MGSLIFDFYYHNTFHCVDNLYRWLTDICEQGWGNTNTGRLDFV